MKSGKFFNFLLCLVIGIIIMFLALFVTLGINKLSGGAFSPNDSLIDPGWAEFILAALAAGFVGYQLQADADSEKKQTEVNKAQFIVEFNKSFIENEKMVAIEAYLECAITGEPHKGITNLSDHRQDLVNYLVYLEGFSHCILTGVLDIDDIDDLFAYRFFLAMNNPEVQAVELCPYATYYRGCFRLYKKWVLYRVALKKINAEWIETLDIPLFEESALYYWDDFEKYANPKEKLSVKEKIAKAIRTIVPGEPERKMKKAEKKIKPVIDVHRDYYKKVLALHDAGYRFAYMKTCCNDLTNKIFEEIAQLIYNTDQYIYPDMFGSEAEAVKVIPKLLKSGKDAMFNLDNIYVCIHKDEIVGLVLWKKGKLDWSSEELRSALQTPVPAKFNDVENQYVNGYKNTDDGTVSILNVCVDSKHRRKSIAKIMLKSFIEAHYALNSKDVKEYELCVLTKNKSAISVYEFCGFKKTGKVEQAYPANLPNHTRISMIYCPEGKKNVELS